MPELLNSLLLVAVAQIPLLLKLWLDHKNAVSGFKLELYKRQVEVCKKLSKCLIVVHQNSETIIKFIDENSLPNDKGDSFTSGLAEPYGKDIAKLMHTLKTVEVLLPAELCKHLENYLTCSSRLLAKGFAPTISKIQNMSHNDIWREQEELFNLIINYMRLVCGTDMLSNSTFRQFLYSSGIVTGIRRRLNR